MRVSCTFLKGANGKFRSNSSGAILYVRIQYRAKNGKTVNIKQSTTLTVDADKYIKYMGAQSDTKHRPYKPYFEFGEGKAFIDKKNAIEKRLQARTNQENDEDYITTKDVREIIDDVVNGEAHAANKALELKKKLAEEEANRVTLEKYLKDFISGIYAGSILHNGEKYSPYTAKGIKYSVGRFVAWMMSEYGRILDFDDLNKDMLRAFSESFLSKNKARNTAGSRLKDIKAIIHRAYLEGVHTNRCFENLECTNKEVADSIFLTKDELERFAAVVPADHPDLFRNPEQAERLRDIFVVGCCIGQRISDYKGIKREYIHKFVRTDGKEITYIELNQSKTAENVVIPASPRLMGLIEKYNYNLPTTNNEQGLNKWIKVIARCAGIDEPVKKTTKRGGGVVEEIFQKWELVTTHTARRTFASQCFLEGMSKFDIAQITGHKSIKQLETYIKADKLDSIERLSNEMARLG